MSSLTETEAASATKATAPAETDARQPTPRGHSLGRLGPVAGFVLLQLSLAASVGAWFVLADGSVLRRQALPPLRQEPIEVGPLYDYEFVVSDEQLRRTLSNLGLPFGGSETMIAKVDHALRFWTPAATFDNPRAMSGRAMLELLTDHRRFAEVYGEAQEPLLIDDGVGIRYRAFEGPPSSSHVDHTAACLAEVGTPLDFPVVTPSRTATFRDVVEESLRDFSLNQNEYEWSALLFAHFLPPVKEWTTGEGQRVSFDMLAHRIMREGLPLGVCMAHHRLHALVVFLRVDEQYSILSPATRSDVLAYLHDVVGKLVEHQHPYGFWDQQWPRGPRPPDEPADQDDLRNRIIATGHVMEWLSLAPKELHPPRHVLASAGQWLVKTVENLEPDQRHRYFAALSHVGRALALWRSRSPAEVVAARP